MIIIACKKVYSYDVVYIYSCIVFVRLMYIIVVDNLLGLMLMLTSNIARLFVIIMYISLRRFPRVKE